MSPRHVSLSSAYLMLNRNVFAFGLLSNRLARVILQVLIHEIIYNPLSTQVC